MNDNQPTTRNDSQRWPSSKTTMELLNISTYELMHQRQAGKLEYEKHGNTYFYLIPHKVNSAETESK
ncbi:hypothetical protein L2744_07125 [Shewanella profunda]|uniref:hypothetical protein n=1 Tax=Shewanella profunda TaxID=254793 RepID=UPI00200DB579|nr:hypothetical protein [Shewanella profunda]MCL1089390.1 hypothetical protein [Shewanella profunda]